MKWPWKKSRDPDPPLEPAADPLQFVGTGCPCHSYTSLLGLISTVIQSDVMVSAHYPELRHDPIEAQTLNGLDAEQAADLLVALNEFARSHDRVAAALRQVHEIETILDPEGT
jgi:hypothetical protein